MRGSCIISKALKVSGGGSPDTLLGILGALRGGSHFLTSGAPSCHGRRQKRKAQAQGASPQALALVGDGAGSWGEACGQTGAQEGGPQVWVSRGKLRSWAHGRSLKYMAFGDIVPS